MTQKGLIASAVAVWLVLASQAGLAQSPFDPPPPAVLDEARSLVSQMKANPRGPYLRIRWFCNDGTVQPPTAYACAERGGGRQHAEYSEQRARLAALGWSVGTIFAAMAWDELIDSSHRNQRLRELPLERYLTDIDNGWVLRLAQDYRGRVQIENEESSGRALLLRLLSDREWVAANYLLALEIASVIPHAGSAEDRTRAARRAAIEIVATDPSFERLRVEIHTSPKPDTAGRVRTWANGKPDDVAAAGLDLAGQLDALYGPSGRRLRLEQQRQLLARQPATAALADRLAIGPDSGAAVRFESISAWLRDARRAITGEVSASLRLLLLDAIREVENELAIATADLLDDPTLARARLLAMGRMLIDATYGVGLLSEGEYANVSSLWPDLNSDTLDFASYERTINALRRVPQWAIGSVRYTFAEALVRYAALDPRAQAFVDDLLRSSPLAGVADVTRRLGRDHAELTGVTQRIAGQTNVAAFGVNPGVAAGRLRIFETTDALASAEYGRGDIVLLPETVAELGRVAGIVTLGEGNPLSHVQLLARNFGIPNVAVLPDVAALLRPLENREVLLAVGSDGSVVLSPAGEIDSGIEVLLRPSIETASELTVPRPDLSVREPIPLAALERSLSGRVVGPKAANLGQLAKLFPGRVAPAVAVPFGVFAEHMEIGQPSLSDRLANAYAARKRGAIDDAELNARLEAIRQAIASLELLPEYRAALLDAMRKEFGATNSIGLFLRSDTNVEDLPQFTGAGLSETLPNLVGVDQQLGTIPRIWASVLSPRAIAWRSTLLKNPEEVYASVLLMQSVPSTKSGVMVTTDLTGRDGGLTVSTGWGVGGAVAGEAVETLVLRPDGGRTSVSEAKTAYQRNLDPAGGIRWLPAAEGPVLTDDETRQLRELAQEVYERYEPVFDGEGRQRPWDIEFGFVDGELTLFQIRPLVERGTQLADRVVEALIERRARVVPVTVSLADMPLSAQN